MTASRENIFTSESTVASDIFFGRTEALREVFRFLETPEQKMVFVSGPRGIGKSAFLRKINRELGARGFMPVFFDLQGKEREPLPQVLHDLAAAIAAATGNEIRYSIADFEDDYHFFEREFLSSNAQPLGKIILLIDEFNFLGDRAILREDPSMQSSAYLTLMPYFRSLVEDSPPVKFVFSAGRSPSDLADNLEPMVKFASSVELDGLGRQETALMIASVNEGGRRFTDAAIDEIQRLTKGYPLFVRWLVSDAVQRGHSAPSGEIDRAEIEERLMILVGKYGDALSPAAESLAPRQRAFCILVAKLRQNGHMATERAISMELRQLGSPIADANADIASEAAGLLETKLLTFNRNFASYSFAVPLIEKWFASAFSMKNIEEAMTATDERLAGYLKTAALAYEEKDYGKAVRLYRAIAVRYPDSFEGRIGLSQALEREGKSSSEDIVSHYEIAYRLDPDGSRRAYKGFLKNAAKAGSPFFLEKVVELGDSTIEDRKAFVRSFFEVWRSQVVEGDFHQFLAAMETKPWILKEYRSEVIGFIDGLMGEFLSANPSAAEEFLSAFRGKIDETQLRIWLVRIRKPLESAPTKIINPPLKPEIPKAVPAEKKRLRISLPPLPLRKLFTGLLVVAAVVAAGLVLPHLSKFWNDLSLEKPERFSKESEIGRLPANQPGLQKPPVTGGVSLKQDTVHIREAAPASASSEKAPDTTARTIAPRKDMPGVAPAPGEVRVMLINASSMLQKGMAAKARKQLAAKGFSPQNIFVGTHSDKVSRVYGYYCSKEYIPVLKEIFGALYPGKPQSFFDISPQEKTINGWIRRSFRDERLDVLIRMPNEE